MPDPAPSTNLQPAPNRLVGRQAELERLAELVLAGQRLVTVFGPAGTGKTRTALALGERLLAEYGGLGGVWLCELAAVRDLEGLCETIAHELGVPPLPAGDDAAIVQRLGAALAARGPLVVVLDNFEQLVELAPSTLAVWLAEAPELRLVVTSREHLRLRGELRFELAPLRLPREGEAPSESEAVILLVDRVQALDPEFELDDRTTPLVVDLVTRLEGLPLAIELAASQVELLGLQGLLDNLHQRLDVLVGDARDGEDRHATLRAAIDWSWGLLDAAEQELMAQCTVFQGGFTAEAADAVLRPSDADRPVRVLLKSLRAKSLLRREAAGEAGLPRLSMFDAVRQFAAERFASEQARDEARTRHAAWYLSQAERWMAELASARGPQALRDLALERRNLLAAYEHAMAAAPTDPTALDQSLRAVVALDVVASIRGPFAAHIEQLEQTVSLAEDRVVAAAVLVPALRARAKVRQAQGRTKMALRDLDAALARAEAVGDARLEAEALVDRGVLHHQRREVEDARALYDRALLRARAARALAIEGRVLGNLAALHHDLHQLDEARRMYHEALEVLREVGDPRLEAIHVGNLGVLELEHGEAERARAHLEAASDLLRPLGDRRLLAIVLGNLGTLEHLQGRLQPARRCHEEALSILREVGDRRSEALCLSRLARATAALGWIDDADGCLAAADRLLGRYPDPMVSATIDLDRGFVELARARTQPDAREASLAAVRERIAKVSATQADAPAWIERSDDIRFAVRLLERGCAELGADPGADLGADGSTASAPATDERQQAAVLVGPEAQWVQVPGEEAHDLRRRKAMRLILDRLVDEHRRSPGAGLPLDVLLEAGWPGEKVMASAGANRVYVALTALRKLGLRTVLLSRDDGYLLDPAIPVEPVDAAWGERPSR